MVALVLPVVWMASGLFGLAKLYGITSKVSLSAAMLDLWLSKKCVKLGVRPEMFGIGLDEKETARRAEQYSKGENLDEEGQPIESRILVLRVEPHQVEGMPDLVGVWYFVGSEFNSFVDGIAHREGKYGEDDPFRFDFYSLKRLSDARLADPVARKAAGLPMFE